MCYVYYSVLLCTTVGMLQIVPLTLSYSSDETHQINCTVISDDVSLYHIKWVK